MKKFRLLLGCFLYLSQTGWAEDVRQYDAARDSVARPVKMAGPAGAVNSDRTGKVSEVNFSNQVPQHQKRPLSEDERRALRKQINEAGNKYSGNK